MYQIIFTPKSEKQLGKLPKDVQVRIINTLKRIRIRPETHITKVVGDNAYKFRVGDYRLIIDLIENKIILLIVKVGHRSKFTNRRKSKLQNRC